VTIREASQLADDPLQGVNLIEASAGTGKTYTICSLYLRLVIEQDYDVQQILVVTFTKAATAELRERIRARLVSTYIQAKASEPLFSAWTKRQSSRFTGFANARLLIDPLKQARLLILS
jgi:ATP-dependent exoDNAse (exonuclease V) beta subunit